MIGLARFGHSIRIDSRRHLRSTHYARPSGSRGSGLSGPFPLTAAIPLRGF